MPTKNKNGKFTKQKMENDDVCKCQKVLCVSVLSVCERVYYDPLCQHYACDVNYPSTLF